MGIRFFTGERVLWQVSPCCWSEAGSRRPHSRDRRVYARSHPERRRGLALHARLDLDPSVLDAQPARASLLHYGYLDPRLGRYNLGYDDVRFFNHSDTPNVVPDCTRNRYGVDIAARDIAVGEELTVNYEGVDDERPEPAYCPDPGFNASVAHHDR